MKKILFVSAMLLATSILFSQTEISSFNATGSGFSTSYLTDYQCLGVNPANLGWTRNNHKMNIGFFEFAGSIYAEPLSRREVTKDLFNNSFVLDMNGKQEAIDKFTNSRIIGIGSVMGVGFSYQDEKIGGFAFNIRDRFYWNSVLNDDAAGYLFLGWDDPYFDSTAYNTDGDKIAGYSTDPGLSSKIYQGTEQNMYTYIEYNLGYGRKVLENDKIKWYAGLGLKYLAGYGMSQYNVDDDGNLIAFSAFSPIFGVDYEAESPSQIYGDGFKKTGDGYGIDIGTTLEIIKKLRISIAVNDIGSIKWNGNVYKGNDVSVWKIETAGLDNYNIFEQGQLIVADNKPGELDTWEGLAEKTMKLPTNFRGGASYRFNEIIEVGADVFVPLNNNVPGSFEKAIISAGCRYDPVKWVQLSLGVISGGKFGTSVPLGFTFYPIRLNKNTWEVGISTRDMLSYFKSKNPTVSLAMGFLRFSFGSEDAAAGNIDGE
jgi:hypothetical protein